MAYTLNRRLAQLVDSNGQLNTGKIPNDYITGDHIADNVITSAMLHTSFTVSTSNLTAIDTDDVSEGSSNLYFTNARADARIAAATTDDLTEGSTNLYFTNARIDSHLSGGTGVTYSSGAISIGQDVGTSATPTFGNITTTGYIAGPATFTIDPAAVGDNTGTVVIAGNLQVDGTTTTINSTTVNVDDLNIQLATGALNAAAADGAGITVDGASATITYDGTNDEWDFNKDINVTGSITASGNITGTLATAAQTNITSVGTLSALTVTGEIAANGGIALGDNDIATFGNSDDLKIYHVANSSSYIENFSGNLIIRNQNDNNDILIQTDDGTGGYTTYIQADGSTGEVVLSHYNSVKFNTSSTGVEVTGGATSGFYAFNQVYTGSPTDTVYMSAPRSNNLGLFTDSTEQVTIDSSGHVGIGDDSPDFKLAVRSPAILTGSTYAWPLDLSRPDTDSRGLSFGIAASGTTNAIAAHNADIGIGHTYGVDSNGLPAYYETLTISHVDQDVGKIGIGITSPEVPLDINFSDSTTYTSGIASGTAAYTPSYSANALQLKNTYTATDGNSVGIWFETTGAGNTGVERVGRIVFVNNADIDYGGDFAFQLRGAGGAGIAEVMRIASDGSGSVGIGTSTPASKLDVNGVVSLKGNDFLDSDTNSHYIKAPTHLYLYSNGTDLNFALTSNGNIGVGINSAVGQGNSDKILHLHNTTNNRTQIHLTNSGTGTTSTDGSYISIDNTNQLYFINKEAQGFYFENGTTNSMQINANNVVLIGGGTHSGANQTLGIGNTTGTDPGLQIRTSDGTGTAGYLFADTTESDNITLESASGTVNIAGYGGAIMASVGSRPSGTWTETQLEIFNSAGNSAEFQLNSSNNIKIRFNDTDRATIDSNGNWTIEGDSKYFNVDGFVEVGRGLTIDRANNNAAIWFTENETDINHVLWNGYNGNDAQTRGANNTGFDGMLWNVYRGIKIRGGLAGASNCLVIENSSTSAQDHTVKLFASGTERLATNTTGVNVTGTVSVGSVETMQILQHRQYSNHTSYNSTTTNSWISSGFTGTFTRLKSNSSIFVKANIAAGMALNANNAKNYAGVRVRVDMGNNNLVGDSSNYYLWLRLDVATVTQHIKEMEGHIPLFYSVNEAAGYFGAAGTTTTFTVQYYNDPSVGSFNRGGINVWGNNSTIEIIEYDGGTLS